MRSISQIVGYWQDQTHGKSTDNRSAVKHERQGEDNVASRRKAAFRIRTTKHNKPGARPRMNVSMRRELALMRACASSHHEAGKGIRQRLCALVRRNIRRLASLLSTRDGIPDSCE